MLNYYNPESHLIETPHALQPSFLIGGIAGYSKSDSLLSNNVCVLKIVENIIVGNERYGYPKYYGIIGSSSVQAQNSYYSGVEVNNNYGFIYEYEDSLLTHKNCIKYTNGEISVYQFFESHESKLVLTDLTDFDKEGYELTIDTKILSISELLTILSKKIEIEDIEIEKESIDKKAIIHRQSI